MSDAFDSFRASRSSSFSVPACIVHTRFRVYKQTNKQTNDPRYDTPIKSKEKLIFYTGLRRFVTRPIFSQHTVGDKHKFERFFQPGGVCVASTFAPIHYPPSPALVFRETAEGGIRLVATGKLQSVDPDRIIVKRIRLAGHPFKIHQRTATLRYMFFNPEDIHWFKSVELTTKYVLKFVLLL
jgi:pre-rRNA-processing protein TSR1